LAEQLLELSNLESGETKLDYTEVSFEDFTNSIIEKTALDFCTIDRKLNAPFPEF